MNDHEAVDRIHTYLGRYVGDYEVARDALAAFERVLDVMAGAAQAKRDLDAYQQQIEQKRVILASIDAEYAKREAALKTHYADVQEKLNKKVENEELTAVDLIDRAKSDVAEAKQSLADIQNAIGLANRQRVEAEESMMRSVAMLKKAKDDYDAYKASL